MTIPLSYRPTSVTASVGAGVSQFSHPVKALLRLQSGFCHSAMVLSDVITNVVHAASCWQIWMDLLLGFLSLVIYCAGKSSMSANSHFLRKACQDR